MNLLNIIDEEKNITCVLGKLKIFIKKKKKATATICYGKKRIL